MTKPGSQKDAKSSLDEFSNRLDAMRDDPEPETSDIPSSGAAWGRALRVSSDLLAGLIVGTVLGLGLDRWLETSPWFLLLGMAVGFGAGLRNLTRTLGDAHNSPDDGTSKDAAADGKEK